MKNYSTENTFHNDLKIAKKLVYDVCGFEFSDLKLNPDYKSYGACSFKLNGKLIEFRVSKITPTKIGQFVSIWKRNKEGITVPFDIADELDFMIISCRNEENFGQFIFPKSALANNEIITQNNKEGKRGIRVYPPWEIAVNKQAIISQAWQIKYFLTIKNEYSSESFELLKNIIIKT